MRGENGCSLDDALVLCVSRSYHCISSARNFLSLFFPRGKVEGGCRRAALDLRVLTNTYPSFYSTLLYHYNTSYSLENLLALTRPSSCTMTAKKSPKTRSTRSSRAPVSPSNRTGRACFPNSCNPNRLKS